MISNDKNQTSGPGQFADVNGLKMYFEIHGNGAPLVLIHGGGSTLYTTFGKILPLLAKTYQVIGVELQAHGHTSDRNAPESFEQDADDVAELLKQLNISAANLFGFSNGGNTAMQVAIRHPKRVSKLIIASAFYKKEGMYPWFWDAMHHASLDNMPKIYQDEYLKINFSQAALQNMHDKDVERMLSFQDWKDEDISSIQVPALVISADQDVVCPEHAVAMYRLFPYGRLTIFPASHGSYMGEIMSRDSDSKVPELFVAMLNEFLAATLP
ncbi:alpha/beta fold hydrolase [Dyadobacter frigoris]|uniref:Alpha/beta hydrolase n=1 Tax=Dyadobacter frigoris TaxID=2576211 RepID=A0A4U6CX63_9BACT|nr:alpha/beta hydrolase [Dyadobacter frigoris]TKT89342.1 alpha/beta hydrolase [Dyadobacter frigoris]GLU55523.1 oxidoreductase [Dyadobacter frigoris]